MAISKKAAAQANQTFQVRPAFKDKFRPSEAKAKIEEIVQNKLKDQTYQLEHLANWTKSIADDVKQELRNLGKDKRYKFLVQVIIGENKGQGVRVGSRCFWDADTDDCTWVTFINESLFCLVAAFAVYLY